MKTLNKAASIPSLSKLALYTILLLAAACSPKLQLVNTDRTLYPITNELPKDERMLALALPYKVRLDSIMNQVVAVSSVEIGKARPEGPLNNMMADAMAEAAILRKIPFDLSYTNYGGLRVPLPQGNIRLFNVFELMPFENMITTVKFSGSDMKSFFDYMARSGGDPIAGASFKIKNKEAINIKIKGEPLDFNKTYTVLTSDYMANGGDGGDIFLKSFDRKEYDLKLRDALLLYFKKMHDAGVTLNPVRDGRITIE